MKKLLVIGKPIDHSLSPELHNHWIKKNKITAHYEKKSVELNDLPQIVKSVRENKIFGLNVTTPYKKEIIKYLDFLSPEAEQTESVNTVYKKGEKIIVEKGCFIYCDGEYDYENKIEAKSHKARRENRPE